MRLRYADLDTFVERFAPNVTRGGIFLASRTPLPVGTVFAFEVQLAGGQVALSGEGKVIWIKAFDPASPARPHGMGVQFTRVDPTSRETLNRILRAKASGRPAAGARPGTQPMSTLVPSAGWPAPNGAGAKAPVDTSVDLAAEYGIDEATLRLTVERYRLGGSRATDEEIEDLLRPEAPETTTLSQALDGLPRLLDPSVRRRTGAFRPLELTSPSGDKAASGPLAHAPGDPPQKPS